MSRPEPPIPRVAAFFDGQNIFHAARQAFGYSYPNYDPLALALNVCRDKHWALTHLYFYTGVPERKDDLAWHDFWMAKLALLGNMGSVTCDVHVFWRPLRYRNRLVRLANGTAALARVGEEKGIDVRLAVDVIRQAHRRAYDVALIFSQDQDLSEVASEIRVIAHEQRRWIKIASAFPVGPNTRNRRGIDGTDWVPIDRDAYDSCIDRRDYRRSA